MLGVPRRLPGVSVLFALFVVGCAGLSAREPTPEEIHKALPPGPTSTQGLGAKQTLPVVITYFDASLSMAGFVNVPPSLSAKITRTEYASLLIALRASLLAVGEVSYFKFGTKPFPVSQPNNALFPGFYDQRDTLLGELTAKFAETQDTRLPQAFVIVTDGIQSSPEGSDFTAIANSVARWLDRGFYFHVLGLRSHFHGTVYTETAGRPRGVPLGTYDSSRQNLGSRPYYLYIFSVRPDFTPRLASVLVQRYSLRFEYLSMRGAGLTPRSISAAFPDRNRTGRRNPLGPHKVASVDSDVFYAYWRGGNDESGLIDLSGTVTQQDPHVRLKVVPDDILLDSRCLSLERQQPTAPVNIRTAVEEVSLGAPRQDTAPLRLSLSMRGPGRSGWAACRFDASVKAGGGSLPGWVRDWSTTEDRKLTDFTRTLFFYELMSSLLPKGSSRETTIASFHLAIRGR